MPSARRLTLPLGFCQGPPPVVDLPRKEKRGPDRDHLGEGGRLKRSGECLLEKQSTPFGQRDSFQSKGGPPSARRGPGSPRIGSITRGKRGKALVKVEKAQSHTFFLGEPPTGGPVRTSRKRRKCPRFHRRAFEEGTVQLTNLSTNDRAIREGEPWEEDMGRRPHRTVGLCPKGGPRPGPQPHTEGAGA